MSEMPVVGAQPMLPGKIRPDASRSPQMRIVVLRLPWSSGCAESYYILRDHAHLLGVTVGAALAAVNYATMRLRCRERLHGAWRLLINLRRELARGENTQNHERNDKEAEASHKCNHECIAENRWGSVKEAPGLATLLASVGHIHSLFLGAGKRS